MKYRYWLRVSSTYVPSQISGSRSNMTDEGSETSQNTMSAVDDRRDKSYDQISWDNTAPNTGLCCHLDSEGGSKDQVELRHSWDMFYEGIRPGQFEDWDSFYNYRNGMMDKSFSGKQLLDSAASTVVTV